MCGYSLPSDATFCQKCGTKRLDPETEPPPNETCACGTMPATDAVFCQQCGSKRPRPQDEPPEADTCLCGMVFAAEARFCQGCGSKRLKPTEDCATCACGSALPRDARFCSSCGQNQFEPSQELKLIKGEMQDAPTMMRKSETVQARTSGMQRTGTGMRKSETLQARTSGMQRTGTGDATGKVALASKFANQNGGERSADVAQSPDELSSDAATGRPGPDRGFRKYGHAVIASNRLAATNRAVSIQGGAVAQKASEKMVVAKASTLREGQEPEEEANNQSDRGNEEAIHQNDDGKEYF